MEFRTGRNSVHLLYNYYKRAIKYRQNITTQHGTKPGIIQ